MCPKILTFELELIVPPGCSFTPFFDIPGFFYEVQVEVPKLADIFIAVYGLTEQFGVVAANTLRHSELIILTKRQVFKASALQAATLTIPSIAKQWKKAF